MLSDVGGHHFQNTMFGASSHPQSQETSAVHHDAPSIRPSPQVASNTSMRVVAQGDTPMTEPSSSTTRPGLSGYRSRQLSNVDSSVLNAAQQSQHPPPSPRVRPQSQHPTPLITAPNPASFAPRTLPSSAPSSAPHSPINPLRSPAESVAASPRKIKVKSLSHIHSFATDETSAFSQTRSLSRRQRRDPNDVGPQYEISEMPVSDIIEMVAGLLTKITTTNDRQHEHLHRQIPPPEGTSGLTQQTTSVLAFHGKNVPSISILSYLSRIHKYCPTTYEVFLSLLVYFDRMTERVNSGPIQSLRQANQISRDRYAGESDDSTLHPDSTAASTNDSSPGAQAATPPPSGSLGKPAETQETERQPPSPSQHVDTSLGSEPYNLSHFFVVDSFNIHRLVIAGVTCASKFFSDVFYTNSRYAKVSPDETATYRHLLTNA